MACSRCGQRTRRSPVGGGGRPGTTRNPGTRSGQQTTSNGAGGVKDAISGLRYVPTK